MLAEELRLVATIPLIRVARSRDDDSSTARRWCQSPNRAREIAIPGLESRFRRQAAAAVGVA